MPPPAILTELRFSVRSVAKATAPSRDVTGFPTRVGMSADFAGFGHLVSRANGHPDLSVHTADDIALVQAELNQRPRKILGWDSPANQMAKLLATTSVLRR